MRKVVVVLAVVQANLQQPLSFAKLDRDFRRVDTIGGVEVAPNLTNGVRCTLTRWMGDIRRSPQRPTICPYQWSCNRVPTLGAWTDRV